LLVFGPFRRPGQRIPVTQWIQFSQT